MRSLFVTRTPILDFEIIINVSMMARERERDNDNNTKKKSHGFVIKAINTSAKHWMKCLFFLWFDSIASGDEVEGN